MNKREAVLIMKQVNTILNEWDFLSILPGEGGPEDEYDCMVGPLVTLLVTKNASRDVVDSFIQNELKNHFGIDDNFSKASLDKVLDKLMILQSSLLRK